MRRAPFVAPVVAILACSDDPAPAPALVATELIHLVTDAGQTGTRFCVFTTRREATSPDAPGTCSEPREFRLFRDDEGNERHCISRSSFDTRSERLPVTATGGLQDLVDDPDRARTLVDEALGQVENALRARDKKLTGAAILGTSGFRDVDGNIVTDRFNGLFRAVAKPFEDRQIPIVTRALKPQEESRFAWLTIRFLHLENEPFSVIETGGGGCHFATGQQDAEYEDITSASDPTGTSKVWQAHATDDLRQELIPALKDPAFKVCYSGNPADAAGQDADGCVALLRQRVFDPTNMARLAKETRQASPGRTLYGMGPAWNGLFTTYFKGRGSATADEIHRVAVEECARPGKDGRGFIKHQSCFALGFQEAFLRSTAAGDDAKIRNGVESWPRGASVSPGGEFEACKDSTIKVVVEE